MNNYGWKMWPRKSQPKPKKPLRVCPFCKLRVKISKRDYHLECKRRQDVQDRTAGNGKFESWKRYARFLLTEMGMGPGKIESKIGEL
jgi:hypothetical protein